jgi:hypothetical protein
MKRYVPLLLVFLSLSAAANAQLLFTRADVEGWLTDRTLTMYSTQELSGVTIDLGAAGSGQVYDFTSFPFDPPALYDAVFVSPDVTPYVTDYPTATHAMVVGTSTTAFHFSRLDDTGQYNLGFATEFSGTPYIMKYDPEMPDLLFPLQLGSSWTYTSNESMPMEGFYMKTEMQIDAVSEGILMTAQGSWSALCLRNRERITDRIEFGGTVISEQVSSSVSYMFLTKNGVSASLTVDTLDAASWTPRVLNASVTLDQVPNAVHAATTPGDFGIVSVHPHPVTGSTTVVTLRADRSSTLTLHDSRGRELRRFTREAAPGMQLQLRIAVGDLAPGMYFLRLASGGTLTQKPLLILR